MSWDLVKKKRQMCMLIPLILDLRELGVCWYESVSLSLSESDELELLDLGPW